MSDELLLRGNLLFKFIIHKKHRRGIVYGIKMFGKSNKRQIKDVTFVQPLKSEIYFYTPIAYATSLKTEEEKEKQVFTDSDLAIAGKLKLIFEREKMTWFEIREEKARGKHFFALYYFPYRLVSSRASFFEEKATLQEIKKMFDFIVTEDQMRLAEVQQIQSPKAYRSIEEELPEEKDAVTIAAVEEPIKELEAIPIVATRGKH